MNGRLNTVLAFATAALLAAPAVSAWSALTAQDAQGRFRVMVPRFFPDEGTDDDFGKDTAKRIREALDALPTHSAMEEGEIKDALKRFEIDMDDLIEGKTATEPCLGFRQLGSQINTEVALCVNYRAAGRDMVELYRIEFWQLQQQQSFALDPFTVDEDDDEGAAERIMARFDEYVQHSNYRTFCYDYAQSQDWESALRNCNQALEINPQDVSVLAQRAYVYQQQGELEASLEDLEAVLEIDPVHESALQRAGFVATTLGRNEEGRDYYSRYLELNPGAVAIRRKIAYDVWEAGDPEGAVLLTQEGLEVEPDNLDLLLDLGNYSVAAAGAMNTSGQQDSGTLTPEVAELYRNAVDAYMRVYETDPDTMSVLALRNVMAAHIQLDELDRAVEVGGLVTGSHPDEAGLWAVYADALRRSGNLSAAIDAMAEVERIDPEYENLYARQGSWMLEAGRVEEAVPFLRKAVERGQDPNTMAQLLLSRAHANGVREENFDYAIDVLTLAKESFDVSPERLRELNFWHAYSIYVPATKAQEAGTLASARATLPRFQEARRLFEGARGYTNQNVNIDQYIDNTDTYIEIQQAIIKRGGG